MYKLNNFSINPCLLLYEIKRIVKTFKHLRRLISHLNSSSWYHRRRGEGNERWLDQPASDVRKNFYWEIRSLQIIEMNHLWPFSIGKVQKWVSERELKSIFFHQLRQSVWGTTSLSSYSSSSSFSSSTSFHYSLLLRIEAHSRQIHWAQHMFLSQMNLFSYFCWFSFIFEVLSYTTRWWAFDAQFNFRWLVMLNKWRDISWFLDLNDVSIVILWLFHLLLLWQLI